MRLVDSTHHLRTGPRYKLFQPAEMVALGKITRVHILDLSAGGALLHAADPPQRGTSIKVDCGRKTRIGRVAWVDQRRFGVAFVAPLRDAEVSRIIADQDALVAVASRRFVQPLAA